MDIKIKREILKRIMKGESLVGLIELPLFPPGDEEIKDFNEIEPGVYVESTTGVPLDQKTDRYFTFTQNFNDEALPLLQPKKYCYHMPGFGQNGDSSKLADLTEIIYI